jgi:hypothetical protein
MTKPSKKNGTPHRAPHGASPLSQGGLSLESVLETMKAPGLGFERVEHVAGSTYKDSSTVLVIPTRSKFKTEDGEEVRGLIPSRVVQAWQGLIAPMNQKRAILFASGHEVGQAYDAMIRMILEHPELSKWRYVMTLEDDNIPPPDAHLRLLETIQWGHYDAVSAIYFTKGEINMPMAYGDPAEYQRTGQLDFRPRDVKEALAAGQVMPVNGIAMGCALWKMSLFREIPPPWYVTLNDLVPGKGIVGMTQDLSFCQKAVLGGKRFAVDMRVRVGHLDIASGTVF